MSVELATAYVSIVPSAKGIAGHLQKELGDPAESEGKSAGGRFGSAMSSVASKALKVGAGAVVGGFGAALVKGFGRLRAIDDARFKLQGLGHDASTVDAIMENALASVKGTAFGLGDAATIAASAVAAGIKPGRELERTLSLTGDAATIAGVSLDDMGAIFNVVASKNRLSMMEVNRLGQRGIGVMGMLAEHYGVTADEATDMVSRGEVDFATFQEVLENNLGGAALAAGESFGGAFANMGAALGRFGATLLGPTFEAAKGWFTDITAGIDNFGDRVGPFAEMLSGKVIGAVATATEWFGRLGSWWQSNGPAIIERVTTLGGALRDVLGGAFDFISGLWSAVLEPALSAIKGSMSETDGLLRQTLIVGFDLLVGLLRTLGTALATAGRWMEEHKGATQALAAVITAMFIPAMVRSAAAAVTASARKVAALVAERAAQVSHLAFSVRYYATLAAQAVASAARVVASWVATAAAAVANTAVMVAQGAVFVARWAFMGAQSLFHAAKVALAWLIAMGPIALVIAAVVGLVAIIVANWDRIKSVIASGWDWVRTRTVAFVTGMVTTVTSIKDRIVGFFAGAKDWLLDAGRNIIAGLISGITSMIGKVGDAIGNVVSKVTRFLPWSPAKEGPLRRRPPELGGRNIVAGMAGGMTSNLSVLAAAADAAAWAAMPSVPAVRVPSGGSLRAAPVGMAAAAGAGGGGAVVLSPATLDALIEGIGEIVLDGAREADAATARQMLTAARQKVTR